jgi:amino acid transporter
LSLIISTLLYVLVAIVATFAIPADELAGSAAPLALIVESRGFPPEIIAAISLFAVINGALIQIIMASRVLYGLASDGLAFASFALVNNKTRTPVISTLFVASLLLALTLVFSLGGLARMTSFIALAIFTVVNLALLRLKRLGTTKPEFSVPTALPLCGAILCLAMIGYQGLRYLQ